MVWLRIYPTYEVLGWLFGLEKSNAWENVQDALAVLGTLAEFPFERPAADRAKLATPAAVIAAFPEVKIVIDGKEQPFRRPQGWDQQKPFYSGKKKRHTVKNQVVCTPEGRIGGVSDTVPGSTHDLTMMRGDGTLDRLDEGESAMADKAYTGGAKDRPGTPLVVPTKATRGHPLTEEQKAANRVISGYRVVIEHVMAQLNRFQVLKQVFRSAFERHTAGDSGGGGLGRPADRDGAPEDLRGELIRVGVRGAETTVGYSRTTLLCLCGRVSGRALQAGFRHAAWPMMTSPTNVGVGVGVHPRSSLLWSSSFASGSWSQKATAFTAPSQVVSNTR